MIRPPDGALSRLDSPAPAPAHEPWVALVVDDDPEVHTVTRLCFAEFEFEGRPLALLSAHSAEQARKILQQRHDIAVVLLDVVMESEHAGLELARYIREELGNHAVRIVLRTGQPGQAPAREVARRYQIDDYRTKTELTFERLHVLTVTALRTYGLLRAREIRERRLAQYSDELERFASAASHDLQTPLRTVVRFAQRLRDKHEAQLPPEGREYLRYVLDGARELHDLVQALMEFLRVGRIEAPPEPVALAEVVREACAGLREALDARAVRVDCGVLPTVRGDREQLDELFVNLLDNAIKFQPGPNPVVSIAATRAGDHWEIRVSDRGIGIEPQHLDRIFEPFQRLHPDKRFPGVGIGLAICRKVAQLHGGSIRAQSVPGTGTTMIVTLPAE